MRALNKSEEYENLYQNLGHVKDSLFSSMKDVYVFAALIGSVYEGQKKLNKRGGEPIKEGIFNYDDKVVFDFIAINSTKDINILKNDPDEVENKCKLIEECANWGIEKLSQYLNDDPLNIDNLVECIREIDKDLDNLSKGNNSNEDLLLDTLLSMK